MTPGRLALAAACGLAALYAAGLVYEMDFARPGCCGLGWPHPDPVAAARWQAAADPSAVNPAIQRGAALTLLAAEPANANAWMRLAWADRLAHGRLTRAGAGALEMSYLVQLYSAKDVGWRVAFVLDNWSRIPVEIREDAVREAGFAQNRATWGQIVVAVRRGITDPEGRKVAAAMGLPS
jgi:hypothetical protein